jgi:hypothetical protein
VVAAAALQQFSTSKKDAHMQVINPALSSTQEIRKHI